MSSAPRSGGGFQGTFRWAGRMGIEARVVTIEGRAIGADDLVRVAHVEEDVRMIERWRCADALELPGADLDHRHARRIVKVRNDVLGHGRVRCGAVHAPARGTITSRSADS